MKKQFVLVVYFFILLNSQNLFAQSPQGKPLGFGIMVGDPVGFTVKYWINNENAYVFDLASSYFGSPRFDVDYLWHFDAFHSEVAKLYAGPGAALGFGNGHSFYYNDNGSLVREDNTGLGVRGVFGLSVIPLNTPLDIFCEVGLLVGLVPDFGSAVDASLGIRFYP
ncbi:MAG: hypothetical protein WCA84_17400 [Ignavibacteriaceae bacterium]|jgi:hypothetical protein